MRYQIRTSKHGYTIVDTETKLPKGKPLPVDTADDREEAVTLARFYNRVDNMPLAS